MKAKYKVPAKLKKKLKDAVAYLTEHPQEIQNSWRNPYREKCGVLFRFAHPTPIVTSEDRNTKSGRGHCGCLTQIRRRIYSAYTPELTKAIRADKRLPRSPDAVTAEDLPFFQEWMLKLAVIFEWQE